MVSRIGITLGAAVAVVIATATLRADETATKKPPKPKDHFSFTYAAGAKSFLVVKKTGKHNPLLLQRSNISGAGFVSGGLEIQADGSTPGLIARFDMPLPKMDYAKATYPKTLTSTDVPFCSFDLEDSSSGSPVLLGNWGTGGAAPISIVLDSYDKKSHKLVGHFSGTLSDRLLGHPNGDLVTAGGEIRLTVPGPLRK